MEEDMPDDFEQPAEPKPKLVMELSLAHSGLLARSLQHGVTTGRMTGGQTTGGQTLRRVVLDPLPPRFMQDFGMDPAEPVSMVWPTPPQFVVQENWEVRYGRMLREEAERFVAFIRNAANSGYHWREYALIYIPTRDTGARLPSGMPERSWGEIQIVPVDPILSRQCVPPWVDSGKRLSSAMPYHIEGWLRENCGDLPLLGTDGF